MKEWLDLAPKIIAIVSFYVLLVSVVHEYGYFQIVGPHLQTIATTYDYLANAFLWLPAITGAILVLQAIETAMTFERIETDGQAKYRIKYTKLFHFAWIVSALGILAYLFFGGVTVALAVISCFAIAVIYYLTRGLKAERETLYAFQMFGFAIYIVLLAFGYGIQSAYSDLAKTTDVYSVEQKDNERHVRQLVLLRTFDKGILVRDFVAERVEFIKWDNVASLSRFLPIPLRSKGYLCIWFDAMCGKGGPERDMVP